MPAQDALSSELVHHPCHGGSWEGELSGEVVGVPQVHGTEGREHGVPDVIAIGIGEEHGTPPSGSGGILCEERRREGTHVGQGSAVVPGAFT
jgi:hypothetical protein